MPLKPYYIASFDESSGQNKYLEPFLIPEKSYVKMNNFSVYRGRIRRKRGHSFLGQLERSFTNVTAPTITTGPYTTNVLNLATGYTSGSEPNAYILIGTVYITIDPGGANETHYKDAVGILIHLSGPYSGSGVINYQTGVATITFTSEPPSTTAVHISFMYAPALPVMALPTRQATSGIANDTLLAFDTKYAYIFNGSNFVALPSTLSVVWKGTDYDFFWIENYYNNSSGPLTWITNGNFSGSTSDALYYYDGTTLTLFDPALDSGTPGNKLQQCEIFKSYKGRLLALNTYEGTTLSGAVNYPQRIRWSQNGDPTNQTNGWRSDIAGYGGYLDIPTSDQIISCEAIKDILLVKCQNSSWKLTSTGDPNAPFIPQRINIEFGCESAFSIVPFDRGVLAVGNVGITADDGVNVERIDQVIPDLVLEFSNDNQGPQRVYGIRDYTQQFVYWTYPDSANGAYFPNKVIAYNYLSKNWSVFENSFTCFGYYTLNAGYTWATLPYESWDDWVGTWEDSNTQTGYPSIIAGNNTGAVVLIYEDILEAPSYLVTNVVQTARLTVTVPSHNLQTGDFVRFDNFRDRFSVWTQLNGPIYQVTVIDQNTFTLSIYNPTTGQFDTVVLGSSPTYLGGAYMGHLPIPFLQSKFFCPFYEAGSKMRLPRVDLLLDTTDNGSITFNAYIDEDENNAVNDPTINSNAGLWGNNQVTTAPNTTLYPYQASQQKIWQTTWPNIRCQNFMYAITLNDAQMSDIDVFGSDIVLHATVFYAEPVGRLTP